MRLKQTEIGVTQATMKQWKEEGHTHTHTPRSQNEPAVGKKKPSVPAFPLRLRLGKAMWPHSAGCGSKRCSLYIYHPNHPHVVVLSQCGMLDKRGRDWTSEATE